MFVKCAYSTEKRHASGQEATEQIHPWHNMYALFHLIEAQLPPSARAANKAKLDAKPSPTWTQFAKRTAGKRQAS